MSIKIVFVQTCISIISLLQYCMDFSTLLYIAVWWFGDYFVYLQV